MSKFSDWEFMLNGDFFELRQLVPNLLTGSLYFNIYGGVNDWLDCPNVDFRMTTLYCEGKSDPQIVWQIGDELISLFNGASILFDKNHIKVSISKLFYQERRVLDLETYSFENSVLKKYSPQGNTLTLLGKPPFCPFYQDRIDEELRTWADSKILDFYWMRFPLIYLATENEDVYCILKYLDMEANWTTYYKLMESIKTFAVNKGIEINTIKDEKTLEAFHNTANNFSLSKLDSRHGFKNQNKKNKTDSISLDDTHKFFIKMAKEFLVKVYFTPFNPFNNLAKLYEDQGNYAKAKYFYERSLEIFEKFLSKEHPNTRQVRENYNALIQKMQDTKF